MQTRQRHGRKGTGTEYYEWQFTMPAIVVQKVGDNWLLGVTHTDKRWQIPAYYPTLLAAKNAAERLVQAFLAAVPATPEQYWQITQTLIEQDATVAYHLVDTTGRD